MLKSKHLAITLLSLSLVTSCQKDDGINQFQPTPVEGWNCKDTLHFDMPASSVTADYDVLLQARISRKFEYRDLWLVVEQKYGIPDSLTNEHNHSFTTRIDTIRLELTDEQGELNGQGRDLLEYKAPVRFIRLKEGEGAQVSIHHVQSDASLKGVHDVGIEISRVAAKTD